MTVTPKVLISSKFAVAAETTQYTSPGATRTIIDKFTGTNTTAGVVLLTVRLIPVGDVPAASNTIVYTKALQGFETYSFPELVGHILSALDYISTLADTAAAITIRASGRQVN